MTRLAIASNSVVRECEGLGELVGLRSLCITECHNLAPSLRKDDTADVAAPQLYAACIGISWRCERVLCKRRLCIDDDVACCGLGRLCSGWSGWGFCEGRAEGRRCVQTIGSEMMGQRRWHRASE